MAFSPWGAQSWVRIRPSRGGKPAAPEPERAACAVAVGGVKNAKKFARRGGMPGQGAEPALYGAARGQLRAGRLSAGAAQTFA